jgi:hypothetical protein
VLPPQFFTPDLRRTFSAARAYLDGAITIHELNGAVAQALAAARLGGVSEQIVEYLEAWRAVINRRWNEVGTDCCVILSGPPANSPLQRTGARR